MHTHWHLRTHLSISANPCALHPLYKHVPNALPTHTSCLTLFMSYTAAWLK